MFTCNYVNRFILAFFFPVKCYNQKTPKRTHLLCCNKIKDFSSELNQHFNKSEVYDEDTTLKSRQCENEQIKHTKHAKLQRKHLHNAFNDNLGSSENKLIPNP